MNQKNSSRASSSPIRDDQEKSTTRTTDPATGLFAQGIPLPPEVDRELLLIALAMLTAHHEEYRNEATRSAHWSPNGAYRERCQEVAAHHQEQTYQIGEQIALLGGRNGWPRPRRSGL